MLWLPDDENFLNMFIRLDRIQVPDRQTDGQTHTQTLHDSEGHPCIASCDKNTVNRYWGCTTVVT